jgi:CubicO group peptidase (beta-lactamase class C family)
LSATRIRRTAALLAWLASAPGAAGELAPLPAQPAGVGWPAAEWETAQIDARVDGAELAQRMNALLEPRGDDGLPDTRALLVVAGGRIVAERYADGYGPESRFVSWSMAKSVTHALVGILVRDGRLELRAPAPVPEWPAGDPRREITLEQLLWMTSGLDNGDGKPLGASFFAAELMFGAGSGDEAAFAAGVPLIQPPGTYWAYSTATSTLVAGIVGRRVGGGRDGMLRFMRSELFDPLGMSSAVPEFDAAGTFLGGSSMWATARDWARFGLLYLRDGVWDGRRILPEGWVDHARTPSPASNNGSYGAHFWLSLPPADGQWPTLADSERTAFMASGANGQVVMMVPTRDLVLVRLGEAQKLAEIEIIEMLGRISNAFPERE